MGENRSRYAEENYLDYSRGLKREDVLAKCKVLFASKGRLGVSVEDCAFAVKVTALSFRQCYASNVGLLWREILDATCLKFFPPLQAILCDEELPDVSGLAQSVLKDNSIAYTLNGRCPFGYTLKEFHPIKSRDAPEGSKAKLRYHYYVLECAYHYICAFVYAWRQDACILYRAYMDSLNEEGEDSPISVEEEAEEATNDNLPPTPPDHHSPYFLYDALMANLALRAQKANPTLSLADCLVKTQLVIGSCLWSSPYIRLQHGWNAMDGLLRASSRETFKLLYSVIQPTIELEPHQIPE